MARTPQQLVSAEVLCCMSSLVSTLALDFIGKDREARQMIEQAEEIAAPIDDWEEAAIQEGWSRNVARMTGNVSYSKAGDKTAHMFEGWQDLCETENIEPYQREVFEHWAVSDWLAEKLEAKGEKVDKDFAGLCIWARTTTGQAIYADAVIEAICSEANAS